MLLFYYIKPLKLICKKELVIISAIIRSSLKTNDIEIFNLIYHFMA